MTSVNIRARWLRRKARSWKRVTCRTRSISDLPPRSGDARRFRGEAQVDVLQGGPADLELADLDAAPFGPGAEPAEVGQRRGAVQFDPPVAALRLHQGEQVLGQLAVGDARAAG